MPTTDVRIDDERIHTVLARAAAVLAGEPLDGLAPFSRADGLKLRQTTQPLGTVPLLWKLATIVLTEHDMLDADRWRRWAPVLIGFSHVFDLREPPAPLGAVLATGGYGNIRLRHLLEASVDDLVLQLPRLGQFLAAKRTGAVNWSDAAVLAFTADADGEHRARIRTRITEEYRGLARHA